MVYVIRHNAGPFERFDPHAFARNIGKTIPVRMLTDEQGEVATHGVILAATVAADRKSAEITLEVGTWN